MSVLKENYVVYGCGVACYTGKLVEYTGEKSLVCMCSLVEEQF